MAKYILKRKTFSGEQGEKKGMGLGTKLALGAATIGGGLLAAKHGAFGAGAQKAVGKGMMNVGMTKSGAQTWAKGQAKAINKKLGDKALTGEALANQEKKLADAIQKKSTIAADFKGANTAGRTTGTQKKAVANAKANQEAINKMSTDEWLEATHNYSRVGK